MSRMNASYIFFKEEPDWDSPKFHALPHAQQELLKALWISFIANNGVLPVDAVLEES